ncbi:MAG TPA: hypothetical protein VMX18_04930 [Candidatus Bipolaricaulota bacterium]|nr:hypothetical protein [Candidatus Bipolaricaulota bacterium]
MDLNYREFENPSENIEIPAEESHRLDKQQKISIAAISLIGVGVLVFGFWRFNGSIGVPFPKLGNESNAQVAATEGLRDDTLKNLDTDNDGLNDYDESYVYLTSPYLEDSDSDGYSDQAEIQNGYDPNCPAGENCFSDLAGESEQQTGEPVAVQNTQIPEIDPIALRAQLLSLGVIDEATLNGIDDETLIQVYKELGVTEGTTGNIFDAAEAELSNPAAVSIEEIKEMLREGGLEEDIINSVDDSTLMDLYNEALKAVEEGQ